MKGLGWVAAALLVLLAAGAVWILLNPAPKPVSTPRTEGPGQAAVPAPDTSSTLPTPAAGDPDFDEDEHPLEEQLTRKERATLVRRATQFLTLFARPEETVDQPSWFRPIRGFLTAEAAENLSWVDPRQIAHSRVTAQAELLPPIGESHLTRMIAVPTDGGLYVVHMLLTEDGSLVQGLTSPGGPQ